MVRRRIPPPEPSHGLHIRCGTIEDEPFVRELSTTVFDQFGDYGSFLPGYLTHPSVFTAIGEHAGLPVGFVMLALVSTQRPVPWPCDPGPGENGSWLDAEVLAIAVRPASQSQGVGRALMDHALARARVWSETVELRSVQLNVADTNTRAMEFFEKVGFVEADPADGTYPKGQRSIRMARRIQR